MNDTKYYYADRNNQPIGPYTFAELRQLQISGQVLTDTYVIEEGGQSWKPLANIIVLSQTPGTQQTVLPPLYINNNHERKSKLVAGLLGILLGSLGAHNFYLGYNGKAIAQLLMSIFSLGILAVVSAIWGLIEGIMILTGSINKDAKGNPLSDSL